MSDISVLMSVYNESEEEIKQSLTSVLGQTYKDFEVILVNDNPKREGLRNILRDLEKADVRVRNIENKTNIGLAMSINKAAYYARGTYLLRMDSDDICDKSRFEEQIKIIKTGKYDLICSEYVCIDEKSKKLPDVYQKSQYFKPEEIKEKLPFDNSVIHHPTVMFTRSIFQKVNGYRDFPCAQDYDLWLRMLEAGAQFFMIRKPLLLYRIHGTSISSKNSVRQNVTVEYIRRLYIERLLKGNDSFNMNNYGKYLSKYIDKEEYYKIKVDQGKKRLLVANCMLKENKKIKGIIMKAEVITCNTFYRKHFVNLLIDRLILYCLKRLNVNKTVLDSGM